MKKAVLSAAKKALQAKARAEKATKSKEVRVYQEERAMVDHVVSSSLMEGTVLAKAELRTIVEEELK